MPTESERLNSIVEAQQRQLDVLARVIINLDMDVRTIVRCLGLAAESIDDAGDLEPSAPRETE